jgi:ATP-binding cassette subfamily B protein
MKFTWFARVRRYVPRTGGLWLVWLAGLISACLSLALLLEFGLLAELFFSGTDPGPDSWLRRLYDRLPDLRTPEMCLLFLLTVGLALAGFDFVVQVLHDRWTRRLARQTASRLRQDLRRQAFHLGASELLGVREASPAQLFTERVETVREGLVAWWDAVPREVFRLLLFVGLALLLHVWLALAAMLTAVLLWLLLNWLADRARQRQILLADRAAHQMSLLIEGLGQVRLVRGLMLEDIPGQPFDETLARYHKEALARDRALSTLAPLACFLILCGVALVLGLAGLNIFHVPPRIEAFEAAVLFAALAWACLPLYHLVQLRSVVERSDEAASEIYHYLDREPGVGQLPEARELPPLHERLELAEVTLVDGAGHKLLDQVSLEIPAGSRVALVSLDSREPHAMIGLLPRFYDPQQGRVLFDRQDSRHATLESLRNQTVLVTNHGLLFTGTVAENISCGDPRFNSQQISEAAIRAHADEFILRLPLGFATTIGEHGMGLSPSQQFRVGVARVLLRNPAVVVLEEPNEELDAATAELVDRAIEEAAQGRTVILLPSRQNTLRQADRVFLFHEGRLHDAGTHAELVQKSELYRHLLYMRYYVFRDGRG